MGEYWKGDHVNEMHVGVTGTRKGMTPAQGSLLTAYLVKESIQRSVYLHHGCCVGVDAQANGIAVVCGIPTVGHPPEDTRFMAIELMLAISRQPRPYLDRNKDIVDISDLLLVVPSGMRQAQRSGTWSTYRYAKKIEKPTIILYPDGSVSDA